ncbi:MAG: beta-lactamase family protein [Deltaproteobacteria bacterium]|nr:beta-lactamase family protein [Deltaproteobacteria bacterium]
MQLRLVPLLVILAACGGKSVAPPPSPPPPPPAKPAPVAAPAKSLTGIWLGTLHAGDVDLRVQLHLDLATTPAGCSGDSLDQGVKGIACTDVVATATSLAFTMPAVHATYTGTVSADGNTITGTFTQGGPLSLTLTRQATALEPAAPMPPVGVDKIQQVMTDDMATLLAGELAPSTGIGVTIGVIEHGKQTIFSFGAAKPDSVFEIGSVTKTFTGLVLAQLVQQHQVRLDQPVRELLPKGTVAKPATGAEITLVDLSAQRSGLPRMPDNMAFADPTNPYADYDAKGLYAYIGKHGVAMPEKPEFAYSNLGVGLLGQALAEHAHSSYDALVAKQITGPLGMHDTAVTPTPAMAKRFLDGHGSQHAVVHHWDLAALAGAGALRSTAGDMLVFLQAQLHPESVKGTSPQARTLAAAITASHAIQGESMPGMHIAFNWFRIDATGEYWHNGATGGFSSYALFDPDKDFAVVVLVNRGIDDGMLADNIGTHVAARLAGRLAPPLH